MKNIFFGILLTVLCTLLVSAQDDSQKQQQTQGTIEEKPEFGLQANIFRNIRNLNPDFTQNFSIMADYLLTPGDVFTLIVSTGFRSDGTISHSQQYQVQLQENFNLNIPFVGMINARNKSLPELQDYIVGRIKNMMPVQYVNFKLTAPAQFNVFVYGGVMQPGYIIANPLMGVVEAIAVAGGFKPGASYRQIRLIRTTGGKETTETIDISRFYADAEFESNPPLQPDDKIYVPQADIVTTIEGEIYYPGSYELLPQERLKTLLNLAGGFTPEANPTSIDIYRVDGKGARNTISVDKGLFDSFSLHHGDIVTIPSITKNAETVTVEGAIFGKPYSGNGPVQVPHTMLRIDLPYHYGMTLLSVLDAVGGPTPFLSVEKQSYIEREETGEKIPIDVNTVWDTRNPEYNLKIRPGDYVRIAMKELNIFLTGEVKKPGAYPYKKGATLSDYLLLAGGIDEENGDPNGIYLMNDMQNRSLVKTDVDVRTGDHFYVSKRQKVFVTGEVSNPGAFPYHMELTVSDYILLAGGIKEDSANPNGIFFMDKRGKKTKTDLLASVSPGSNIYVSKNLLYKSDRVVQDILITTGWVTAIIGVATTIIEFILLLQGNPASTGD